MSNKKHYPKALSIQEWKQRLHEATHMKCERREAFLALDSSNPESAQNLLSLYLEKRLDVKPTLADVDEYVLIPMLQKIYSPKNAEMITKLVAARKNVVLNPKHAAFVVQVILENLNGDAEDGRLMMGCLPAMSAFEHGGTLVDLFLSKIYTTYHENTNLQLMTVVHAFFTRFATAHWFDKDWVGYLINFLPQLVHNGGMLHWAYCVEGLLNLGVLHPLEPMFDVLLQSLAFLVLENINLANPASRVLLRMIQLGYDITHVLHVILDTLFRCALVEPSDFIRASKDSEELTSLVANLIFAVAEMHSGFAARICELWEASLSNPNNCMELGFLCALFHRVRSLQRPHIISNLLLRYENNEFNNLLPLQDVQLCLVYLIRHHLLLLEAEAIPKYLNLTLSIANNSDSSSFSLTSIFQSWVSLGASLKPYDVECINTALHWSTCDALNFVGALARVPWICEKNASLVVSHCIRALGDLKNKKRHEQKHLIMLLGAYGSRLPDEQWNYQLPQVLLDKILNDHATTTITESVYNAFYQLAASKGNHIASLVHLPFVKQVVPLIANKNPSTLQQGYADLFLQRILNIIAVVVEKSYHLIESYNSMLIDFASNLVKNAINAKTELSATILLTMIECKQPTASRFKVESVINGIKFGNFPDVLALAASRFPVHFGTTYLQAKKSKNSTRMTTLPLFVMQQAMCAVSQMQPSDIELHCKYLSHWLDTLDRNATHQTMWSTSIAVAALKKSYKWNTLLSNLHCNTIAVLNYYDRCVGMFASQQVPMHGTDVTFEFL